MSLESVPAKTFPFLRTITPKRTAYKAGHYKPGQSVLLNWDGGSKSDFYWAFRNGQVEFIPFGPSTLDPDRMGDPFKQRHILPEPPVGAIAMIQAGTFCGKPATPFVYEVVPKP